jgi:hypothetical protein
LRWWYNVQTVLSKVICSPGYQMLSLFPSPFPGSPTKAVRRDPNPSRIQGYLESESGGRIRGHRTPRYLAPATDPRRKKKGTRKRGGYRLGVARPFLMLKALFLTLPWKKNLQALAFQPNRRHQSIWRENLHQIDIRHFIPGALFFRQNALLRKVPS